MDTSDDAILENFRQKVFYHGTSWDHTESIAWQGFRALREGDEWSGTFHCGGVLGHGLYITCNWRLALWYGPTLLRVGIQPGTRLLNAAIPEEQKLVASLRRKFGGEILSKPPWQVLPKNKRLNQRELINLFRYHYWRAWEKEYKRDEDGLTRWPDKREKHFQQLLRLRPLLIRCGFHGYGNLAGENGIVVFSGDRLELRELVIQQPPRDRCPSFEKQLEQAVTIKQVQTLFLRTGTGKAKRLAAQVEAMNGDERRP